MKVLFKLLWILLIAGILEACNASGRLEYALECAATNKGELEKVLEHYKDEPEVRPVFRKLGMIAEKTGCTEYKG